MNDATQTATDPVCGMTVAVNNDAITREHDGTTYYFCGEHCANNFMKAPQLFLETDRPVNCPAEDRPDRGAQIIPSSTTGALICVPWSRCRTRSMRRG